MRVSARADYAVRALAELAARSGEPVTAESIAEVYERRDSIRGLEMVYEPPALRFFQARFRRLHAAGHDAMLETAEPRTALP